MRYRFVQRTEAALSISQYRFHRLQKKLLGLTQNRKSSKKKRRFSNHREFVHLSQVAVPSGAPHLSKHGDDRGSSVTVEQLQASTLSCTLHVRECSKRQQRKVLHKQETPHIAAIAMMWGVSSCVGPTGIEPMTYSV